MEVQLCLLPVHNSTPTPAHINPNTNVMDGTRFECPTGGMSNCLMVKALENPSVHESLEYQGPPQSLSLHGHHLADVVTYGLYLTVEHIVRFSVGAEAQ